ncbi:hypothetical protein [Rheinheimera pacifica]
MQPEISHYNDAQPVELKEVYDLLTEQIDGFCLMLPAKYGMQVLPEEQT